VGSLIKFLEKRRVGVELEEPGTRTPIIALRIFTLSGMHAAAAVLFCSTVRLQGGYTLGKPGIIRQEIPEL